MGYMGILLYPKPYSIYLRGTIGLRVGLARLFAVLKGFSEVRFDYGFW